MPEYTLRYGRSKISFTLDKNRHVDWLLPAEIPGVSDQAKAIRNALDNPLNDCRIDSFRGLRSVAIAINDKTRPVPHDLLLPPLLQKLEDIGLPPEAITLVIATGTHT